jgi:ABC-type bacteriocin/lantibiotic exporter with double-glycine peptidase domain
VTKQLRTGQTALLKPAVQRHADWIDLAGLVAVLLIAALLFGCAGSSDRLPGEGPDAPRVLAVPFYPDDTDQCGPSTLASVLTFWGVPTEPQGLRAEIYVPKLRGTLPMDLAGAVRVRGLQAKTYAGSLDNLKAEVAAGHPVVAFLNLGTKLIPQGHYVVVTGFDEQREGLYVHSGLDPNTFISYNRFLKSWERTGRWSLLVLPPDRAGKA